MTEKYNRIYRMISSFNDEESDSGIKNLTDVELEKKNMDLNITI